jgi:hypothetical protein
MGNIASKLLQQPTLKGTSRKKAMKLKKEMVKQGRETSIRTPT